MMTMNLDDPHQVEDAMEKQIEKHHHEALHPAHAMQNMADGLPALGIVAAVLGIVKTMGSINEPPEILGLMIGKALVGTFLGVFLAYGIVGPMAARLNGDHRARRAVLQDHPRCARRALARQRGAGFCGNRPRLGALDRCSRLSPSSKKRWQSRPRLVRPTPDSELCDNAWLRTAPALAITVNPWHGVASMRWGIDL